ncbi:MAG: PIN domain-containing protein [Deltaproteobacteria bacterium]|nr:PIN domain-containing protein [Deltaproteobacteria bacterium]
MRKMPKRRGSENKRLRPGEGSSLRAGFPAQLVTLPSRVFCDTSFFYACFDVDDENHEHAEELAEESARCGVSFLTTWDIISETTTLLRYRLGTTHAVTFLDEIKPTLTVINYGDIARAEAEEIFRRRGRQRRLSFCDAVSFVIVTRLLDDIPCFAFDRDFPTLGLTVIAGR